MMGLDIRLVSNIFSRLRHIADTWNFVVETATSADNYIADPDYLPKPILKKNLKREDRPPTQFTQH